MVVKMKLLPIPLPQISSYFYKGGKFKLNTCILEKIALFTRILAGKAEVSWHSPVPSVGENVCLICLYVQFYIGPQRWDWATKEKGWSMEEACSLLKPSKNQ